MKRIVVVEDRPWFTRKATVELQKQGIVFEKTIYYPNTYLDSESRDKLLGEYKSETQVPVEIVNNMREFVDKMDELFANSDIIFLMDYDLKGDMNVDDFYSRINIKYALEKIKQGVRNKIWFYTTGGSDVKRVLYDNFPDNMIKTPLFVDEQLYWDEEQIMDIVEE